MVDAPTVQDLAIDDVELSEIETVEEPPPPRVKAAAPETWRTASWLSGDERAACDLFHTKTGLEPSSCEDRAALLSGFAKRQREDFDALTDQELIAQTWNDPQGAVRAWQKREAAREAVLVRHEDESLDEWVTRVHEGKAYRPRMRTKAQRRTIGDDTKDLSRKDGESVDDWLTRCPEVKRLPVPAESFMRVMDAFHNLSEFVSDMNERNAERNARLQSQQQQIDELTHELAKATKAIGAHNIAVKKLEDLETQLNYLTWAREQEAAVKP